MSAATNLRPHTPSPIRFGLLGITYNTDNYGVRVLLSGAVQSLLRAHPCAEILLVDYSRLPQSWDEEVDSKIHHLRLVNMRFSWRLHLPNNIARLILLAATTKLLPKKLAERMRSKNPWLAQILSADTHLSLAGGDSFSDIYGIRRFFYVALPQILVLLLGKRLVLLPQTYGPFNSALARSTARWIVRRASTVYSRDGQGVETLHRLCGIDQQVHISPDLGFTMEPKPIRKELSEKLALWSGDRPLVGFNISSLLFMGGYNRQNMFGLKEEYRHVVETVLRLVIEDLQARVLLIPHVFGDAESEECELKLLRSIAPAFKEQHGDGILFLDEIFDHREIKTVIRHSSLFIGSRMHACIAAVSQCVPTVGLAYSDKFAGVLNAKSLGSTVIDLRTEDCKSIAWAVRSAFGQRNKTREILEQRVPSLRENARAPFHSAEFSN